MRVQAQEQNLDFYVIDFDILTLDSTLYSVVRNKNSFRFAISDASGIVELLSDFLNRANIYVFALKITNVIRCKAPYTILDADGLKSLDLGVQTRILAESQPNITKELNKIISELEDRVATTPLSASIPNALAIQQLVVNRLINFEKLGRPWSKSKTDRWIVLEQTRLGAPFKVASLPESLVKTYQMVNGQALGIFDDFKIKSLLFKMDANPLEALLFDLNSFTVAPLTSPIVETWSHEKTLVHRQPSDDDLTDDDEKQPLLGVYRQLQEQVNLDQPNFDDIPPLSISADLITQEQNADWTCLPEEPEPDTIFKYYSPFTALYQYIFGI